MDKHCGDTLDMVYDLQKSSIRLKLTSNYYYDHDMNCMLTLEAAENEQLMFHFEDMSIEWSTSCKDDWLMLHDGGSINSPTVSGLPGKYCGSHKPSVTHYTSRNMLTLYFVSGSISQGRGFDIIITRYHKGSCGSGEYECSHDRCIDNSLTCNGWNPCGDWSDCPLAVGAIIGIVFGSICFVVVLSVAVCCGCRRRRRLYRQKMDPVAVATTTYGTPGEGYNQSVPQQYPPLITYPTGPTPPPPYST